MAVNGIELKSIFASAGLRLLTRAEWGARAPRYVNHIQTPTPRLWIHHSADDRQGASAVRSHQNFHMDTRGWSDIAYSILLGDDGTFFEGRGIGVQGGHTANENRVSHAICLLGNFQNRRPTDASVNALVRAAQLGRDQRWWVPTCGGHRDAPGASTSCPGNHLYNLLPQIRTRVNGSIQPEEEEVTPEDIKNIATAVWAHGVPDVSNPASVAPAEAHLRWANEHARLAYAWAKEASEDVTALPNVIANAVVAALPAGSVDVAVVKEAVKAALREGTS
jgi:hypothetical protein